MAKTKKQKLALEIIERLQKEYPQADVSDLLEQKEKAKAQKQQPVVYEMEPEDKDRSNE